MATTISGGVNRRNLLGGTASLGLAALATGAPANVMAANLFRSGRGSPPPSTAAGWAYGPFDSLRDYVAELERRGLVLRIPRIDQDAFEATALMYRLIDRFGLYETPMLLFESVKIDGRWVKGPVIVNQYGHYFTEAVAVGIEPVPGDGRATYRAAMKRAQDFVQSGRFPAAPCKTLSNAEAPCKEVILSGDDIDITRYAFIESNPGDAGRYVNTGSVFTSDPEIGHNFGTYRCQIRGPRQLGVNPEPGQSGWRMLMKMKERGDKVAKISIALGDDPLTWLLSTSKIGMGRSDELEIVSAMRGRPLELVKSETNDILVPAHAEMIIEGEIPLDQPGLPEGPFGEMRGYMGRRKEENFWMTITRLTHRRDPWIVNQFTGVNRGTPSAVTNMHSLMSMQAINPAITMAHTPSEAPGFGFVAIRKAKAGDGLAAGKLMAKRNPLAKVVVVVDEDIDVLDSIAVLHAVGASWAPKTAHSVLTGLFNHQLDPSLNDDKSNAAKFVLDATRQLPEEGGPREYQVPNRTALDKGAPDAVARIDAKWDDLVGTWTP